MTTQPCDQDAKGAEAAQVLVDTPAGELVLCQHHFDLNASAFCAAQYPFRPLHGPVADMIEMAAAVNSVTGIYGE